MTSPAVTYLEEQYALVISARAKCRAGAPITNAEREALTGVRGAQVTLRFFDIKDEAIEPGVPMNWHPKPGPLDGRAHP